MLSDIPTTQVNPACGILYGEALVNGRGMRASITHIENHTSCESSGIEGQDARRMEKEFGHLKLVEENSCCFDTIADWVVRGLRQHHRVLSWIDFQFFKDMPPDCLHIVPVLNYTVLHWIAQLENALEFFLYVNNTFC